MTKKDMRERNRMDRGIGIVRESLLYYSHMFLGFGE